MPSIKDYNRKIGSLKNTNKITRTMKMVSASKLRRAQDRQKNASDFAAGVNKLIADIAGSVNQETHILLQQRPVKRNLVLVFTSDKGLCGGFNNHLIKAADKWTDKQAEAGRETLMGFCGKRGFNYFKSRKAIFKNWPDVTAKPDTLDAKTISEELCQAFIRGEFDEIHVLYNHFISPLAQKPVLKKILPLDTADFGEVETDAKAASNDFIAEPHLSSLLDKLIPQLVIFKLYYALLENSAGEHGARMSAMDNASTNAANMIDKYTLLRNRARQAAITTELIEIISGAEAL